MHIYVRIVSWILWLSFCIQIHAFKNHFHQRSTNRIIKSSPEKRFSVSRLNSVPLFIQIAPGNQWGIYATVAVSAATALRLERKTKIGKSLSGPVTAMLISAVLTNIGVLPAEGSIYIVSLQGFVLKLATPMLLFGADLKKIFRETGVMLKAFVLGTVGTMLGSFLGFLLMSGSMRKIGVDGDSWKIASALCAKNVGGGLNFFAVADAVKLSPSALATGLAVDNLLGLLYFPYISWLGAPYDENKNNSYDKDSSLRNVEGNAADKNEINLVDNHDSLSNNACNGDGSDFTGDNNNNKNENLDRISYNQLELSKSEVFDDVSTVCADLSHNESEDLDEVEKTTIAIAFGLTIAAIAESIAKATGVPSIPISTLMTVLIATVIPKELKSIIISGELLGKLLLLLFFASIGNIHTYIHIHMNIFTSGLHS
jgi:hypothetical protein